MVARIRFGKSVSGAIRYNERKIDGGDARLLMANLFATDIQTLSLREKVKRFDLRNQKCTRVQKNTIHISLNFSPQDRVTDEMMRQIAIQYMQSIGFGEQPFLVYRHMDTKHPHIHIVSSLIKQNGRPINCHNIGRGPSAKAREEIELEFGLTVARGRKSDRQLPFSPLGTSTSITDKSTTKAKISNYVREISETYRFTNMDEYNAALAVFNLRADMGCPGSHQHNNKGLIYSETDLSGIKKGIPIAASKIYGNPGLKSLRRRIAINGLRSSKQDAIDARIQKIISNLPSKASLHHVAQILKTHKISLVAKNSPMGSTNYIIDHNARRVYDMDKLLQQIQETKNISQLNPPTPSNDLIPSTSLLSENNSISINHITYALLHYHPEPEPSHPFPIKKKKKKAIP